MKSKFLSLITATLLIGSTETAQLTALDTWADTYVPRLRQEAEQMVSGPFSWEEVGQLAETAVSAAQALKGVFKGTPRATIALVLLAESVKAALPDNLEHWALPLVTSPYARVLIEAAFQKLFGPEASGTPPVVDAPELPEGGVK